MSEVKPHKEISLSKITLLLGAFTLLSRIAGLLRDLILASSFGAGDLLDAYYAAFRIPDLLFNVFILGTLSVAFLPIFNREILRNIDSARRLAKSVFTLAVGFMVVSGIVLAVLAAPLIDLVAPGFTGEQKELAVMLTRIMFLSPILFTIGSVSSVILHSYNKFFPTAAAPILYNIGIIAGAVLLYPVIGPAGLAIGVVIGAAMHSVIQFWALRRLPVKLNISFHLDMVSLREVWDLYLPRLLYLNNTQIALLIGSIVGSLLASGSIAIFHFANNIASVPLGIFAISFAVASFPSLSKRWAEGDMEKFKNLILETSVKILFFIIPLSAFLILLRAQAVRLLLGHGEFTWRDTILTAQTLAVLAAALFAQSLIPLFSRAFYAMYNTKIPVVSGILAAVLNIILAIILSKPFGIVGVGIATSIAVILDVILLFVLLRNKIGKMKGVKLSEKLLKILIASGFGSIFLYAALYTIAPVVDTSRTIGLLIQTIGAGLVGVLVYLIVGLLLNLNEAKRFAFTIKTWFARFSKVLGTTTTG